MNDKWLDINEERSHKIIGCTKTTELKKLGKFLLKLKGKWQNQVETTGQVLEEMKEEELEIETFCFVK